MVDEINILIMGSNGFTAQLLIPLLQSRYQNLHFYSRKKDGELKDFLSSEIFDSSDLIVNCIGPFNLTGDLIVKSVIEKGKKYIDITGELFYVKNSFDKFEETAKGNGATLIHSCAFESFFADHLVNLIAEPEEEITSLHSYYLFDQARPSPGTRSTVKVHNYFAREEIRNKQWVQHEENEISKEVSFIPGKCSYFAPFSRNLFFLTPDLKFETLHPITF